MTHTELRHLCAAVSNFSHYANYRFKALPIITWEFATLSDFAAAHAELERTILTDAPYMTQAEIIHRPNSATIELDCNGVTFRLICREMLMTQSGPVGAADFKPDHTFDFSALQKLRKSGGY